MYLGKTVEHGSRSAIFEKPLHPYTQALLASTPDLKRRKAKGKADQAPIQGEPPSPFNPPSGCAFHTRCPRAVDRCRVETPGLREVESRLVACHLV